MCLQFYIPCPLRLLFTNSKLKYINVSYEIKIEIVRLSNSIRWINVPSSWLMKSWKKVEINGKVNTMSFSSLSVPNNELSLTAPYGDHLCKLNYHIQQYRRGKQQPSHKNRSIHFLSKKLYELIFPFGTAVDYDK